MSQKHPADPIYLSLVAFFCVLLVVSNGVTAKIFRVPFYPSLGLPMGLITYPLTFLITDIISEVYGPKKANLAVYLGFFTSIAALAMIQLALYLPGHPAWVAPGNPFGYRTVAEYETAYSSVFYLNAWAVMGSMVAYLAAQLIDIQIFHRVGRRTAGRHLWLRNNLSTLTSQVIDTLLVSVIVLYFGMGISLANLGRMMVAAYIYKAVFALCDTPLCYLGVYGIRRLSLGSR